MIIAIIAFFILFGVGIFIGDFLAWLFSPKKSISEKIADFLSFLLFVSISIGLVYFLVGAQS